MGDSTGNMPQSLGAGWVRFSGLGWDPQCPPIKPVPRAQPATSKEILRTMSNVEKPLFNVKFSVKELNRKAKKYDKEGKEEKVEGPKKCSGEQQNVARTHTENAIHQKSQATNFSSRSARLDGVVQAFKLH